MLSVFPDLFDFWPVAPFVLRVALALFILYFGGKLFRRQFKNLTLGEAETTAFYFLTGQIITLIAALCLLVGFLAQIDALIIAVFSVVIAWDLRWKNPGLAWAFLWATVVALSLLALGPGWWAFDWPL